MDVDWRNREINFFLDFEFLIEIYTDKKCSVSVRFSRKTFIQQTYGFFKSQQQNYQKLTKLIMLQEQPNRSLTSQTRVHSVS